MQMYSASILETNDIEIGVRTVISTQNILIWKIVMILILKMKNDH